jgi:hypothetical protein
MLSLTREQTAARLRSHWHTLSLRKTASLSAAKAPFHSPPAALLPHAAPSLNLCERVWPPAFLILSIFRMLSSLLSLFLCHSLLCVLVRTSFPRARLLTFPAPQQNPDRLWVLTANSPDDATRICTLLQRLIATNSGVQNKQAWSGATNASASSTQPPSASAPDTTPATETAKPTPRSVPNNVVSPDSRSLPTIKAGSSAAAAANDLPEDEAGAVVKEQETDVKTSARAAGVWLSKKGEGFGALTGEKRRYFVLLYGIDSRMLKFTYFADVQHGRPIDRKGFVPLTTESRVSASGSHITIVRSSVCVCVFVF